MTEPVTLRLIHGDCLEKMQSLSANSVDSIVCDPPYGLSFMGKDWDHGIPGVHFWEAALRVAKPGAHLLAFGGTRTFHRLACAIEDAGWEIRDTVMWVYGCLSDDSEVLTRDGWERYHTARYKEILAYDPQTDVYQWERPSRWSEYRVESDTAYRIESNQTDQLVSRNHRCLVERGGVLAFVAAEECSSVERVPYLHGDVSALPQGPGELLLADVLREGKGLAEATRGKWQGEEVPTQGHGGREEPGMEGRTDVLQAEGQVRRPVDQVRPLSGGVHGHGSQGRLRHGASAVGGDGDRAVAAAERVRASRQPRCDRQSTGEPDAVCDECGSQAARTRPTYQTTLATVTPIEYSGVIFCPTVSTGAFVARRNGKVFVTGNSGFPKSHDVSKAIDKAAGEKRERIRGVRSGVVGATFAADAWSREFKDSVLSPEPILPAAREWSGWGTALKPSWEPIIVARKPLEGTVAQNVLRYGTGGLNVDGCRIESGGTHRSARSAGRGAGYEAHNKPDRKYSAGLGGIISEPHTAGRWPANLIHDGSEEVVGLFPQRAGASAPVRGSEPSTTGQNGILGHFDRVAGPFHGDSGSAARFFYCAKSSRSDRNEGLASTSIVKYNVPLGGALCKDATMVLAELLRRATSGLTPKWLIGESGASITGLCPSATLSTTVTEISKITESRILNLLTPSLISDCIAGVSCETANGGNHAGNAGRSSASLATTTPERVEALARGVRDAVLPMLSAISDAANWKPLTNFHATVKPTALMRYLCRLVTPPGGLVLDPFCGSGSTGKAAVLEGFRFLGIELDPEYVEIAEARIRHSAPEGTVVVTEYGKLDDPGDDGGFLDTVLPHDFE